MKPTIYLLALAGLLLAPVCQADEAKHLFLDVHELEGVTAEAVADAHARDLAVQANHGVNFIRYWVDEANGKVYCLSEARNADDVIATHRDAHGLISDEIGEVTQGE